MAGVDDAVAQRRRDSAGGSSADEHTRPIKLGPADVFATPAGLAALFSLFPWSLLSKGFGDLASAAEGSHPGISWEQRYSYCQADTPSPQQQERLAYWVGNCTMPIAAALWILVGVTHAVAAV